MTPTPDELASTADSNGDHWAAEEGPEEESEDWSKQEGFPGPGIPEPTIRDRREPPRARLASLHWLFTLLTLTLLTTTVLILADVATASEAITFAAQFVPTLSALLGVALVFYFRS